MSIFSDSLKQKRKERGWTQKELAKQVNRSLDTVKSWESGRTKNPDRESMKKLCLRLHTTEEYLLGGEDYLKEWLSKYDSEHQEENLRIKNDLKFFEYCDSLGCIFEQGEEDEAEEFKNKCDKSIKEVYKEIKERN